MKEKVVFCWSGGKDSALALNRLRQDDRYEIVSLLTTCNEHFQRVSMHGVRLELLDAQAAAIGLPLEKIFVSQRSSNEEYQQKMAACLLAHQARGVTACAFGDIFLEDLKRWREENLAKVGLRGIFPIWKNDSRELIREFFTRGFGTVICCVNDAYLGEEWVGRKLDEEFIRTLPPEVDPCGENGEFHSFAFAGPVFRQPVPFRVGEKVYRPLEVTHPSDSTSSYVCPSGARQTKGFWFCDLLPAAKDQSIDSFGVWPLSVREKKCYQCGTPFFCGPKKGEARCWCNEFPPLPPSTTPGADCLCPACLAQKTAGSLPGTLEGPNS